MRTAKFALEISSTLQLVCSGDTEGTCCSPKKKNYVILIHLGKTYVEILRNSF